MNSKELFSGCSRSRPTTWATISWAVDRSVVGVMNSFFTMLECSNSKMDIAGLERWLNDVPIVSRNLFPADRLREKLGEQS